MLTQNQIDSFHRDGFVKIPNVFSGEELERLQAAASIVEQEGLAEAGDHHLYRKNADGSQSYFRSEKMWQRDEIFRIATVKPDLLAAVAQCIGHPFMPWNDSMVTKQPHSDTPIPFHQDPPYFKPGVETSKIPDFVTDIYLDHSVVANGCIHGIAGRHLVGTIDLKQYTEDQMFDDCGAVALEMAPGDVLFHALSAPHGSRNNPTDTRRRTFYLKYQAKEIMDWKDPKTRSLSYDAEGIAAVRNFMAERAAAGYESELGADLALTDDGFVWSGEAHTPAGHWGQLQEKMTAEQMAACRDLLTPLASA